MTETAVTVARRKVEMAINDVVTKAIRGEDAERAYKAVSAALDEYRDAVKRDTGKQMVISTPPAVTCAKCGAVVGRAVINPFRGGTLECEPCFDAEYGPDDDYAEVKAGE